MKKSEVSLCVSLSLLLMQTLAYAGEPEIQTAVRAVEDGGCKTLTIPVGEDVQSIVFNPFNRKVYTANRSSGTVSVIDVDTMAVIATVPVTPESIALSSNPYSGKVYVGGFNGLPPYVNVIDPVSYAASRIVLPEGSNVVTWARSFSFAADARQDRVWFGNAIGPAGDVSVIDDATGAVLARFGVGYPGLEGFGSIPWTITFNPQNNKAYVLGYSIGDHQRLARLTIIDGATFEVVKQLSPLSSTPDSGFASAIFYNPVNNKVYCALNCGEIVIVDGATDNVVTTIPVRGCFFNLASNPHRGVVYAASYSSGNIYVIDGASNRLVGAIDDIPGALGLAYNKVTGNLYALATSSDVLVVIDGMTDEVVQVCPAGPFPTLIINNDGAIVAPDHRTGSTFFANISSGAGSVGVVFE